MTFWYTRTPRSNMQPMSRKSFGNSEKTTSLQMRRNVCSIRTWLSIWVTSYLRPDLLWTRPKSKLSQTGWNPEKLKISNPFLDLLTSTDVSYTTTLKLSFLLTVLLTKTYNGTFQDQLGTHSICSKKRSPQLQSLFIGSRIARSRWKLMPRTMQSQQSCRLRPKTWRSTQ